MQENKKNNKEISTIKLLAVGVAILELAGGFVLTYASKRTNEVMPTTSVTSDNDNTVFDKIDENTPYMNKLHDNILSSMDSQVNSDVKPPYIPNGNENSASGKTFFDGPVRRDLNPGLKEPTEVKPPYIPNGNENSASGKTFFDGPVRRDLNPGLKEPTEVKPPYIPNGAVTETESSKYESDVTLYNQLKKEAPYISRVQEDILYSTNPAIKPTVKPPYKGNEIVSQSNTPYADALHQDIMYNMDPSIKPKTTPDKPPYIPSDSEEHTKSI